MSDEGVRGRSQRRDRPATASPVRSRGARCSRHGALSAAGLIPVVADALDEAVVMTVVQSAEAEVVVHQLTAILPRINIRRFEREFALTNRVRTEGTDHLVASARAVG